MTEEYRQLIEEAHGALYDVLKQTEPGAGLTLHHALNELNRMLDRDDRDSLLDAQRQQQEAARAERDEWDRQYRERQQTWRTMPQHERERLLLDALADKALTKREIARAMDELRDDMDIHESNIANLVEQMLIAGEIEREREPRGESGKQFRWRYTRRTKLDGVIADLERQMEA